jgi:hypothetical protein
MVGPLAELNGLVALAVDRRINPQRASTSSPPQHPSF